MIRPPPGSTLFPYTTLFRSTRDRFSTEAERVRLRVPDDSLARRVRRQPDCRTALPGGRDPRYGPSPSTRRRPHRDRKSTRLNSSHVEISYAVFCLKKKSKSL